MEALLVLDGVGVPTASILLHSRVPADYPILDVRALESLGHKGRSRSIRWLLARLPRRVSRPRRPAGRALRTLDKALWQHSRERAVMTPEVIARRGAAASVAAMPPRSPTAPASERCCATGAQRRRLSQLDLALEAGVSARHLSFVETGRSRPSARDGPAPGRAPRRAAARPQRAAARRRLRARLRASATSTSRRWARSATRSTASCAATSRTRRVVVDRHWGLVAANRAVAAAHRAAPRRTCSSRRSTCCGSACTRRAWRRGSPTSASGARTCSTASAARPSSAATRRCSRCTRSSPATPAARRGHVPDLEAGDDRRAAARCAPATSELAFISTATTFGTAIGRHGVGARDRVVLPRRRRHGQCADSARARR